MVLHIDIKRLVSPTLRAWVVHARGVFARGWRGVTTIRVAVIGASVVMLLFGGWRFYEGWRSGWVELIAEGESVVVQVLEEVSEEPLGERMGLVDRVVIELPAGEYKLRVEGRGRLSRTFRIAVNRGEMLAHRVSIDEGRLLGGEPGPSVEDEKTKPPMRIPASIATGALELTPGKADLVACTEKTVSRRDGATGKVNWEVVSPQRLATSETGLLLPRRMMLEQTELPRTRFLGIAPDLDGDGTGDLILSLQREAAFVAFSGKTGAMLWKYFADANGQPRSPANESDPAFMVPTDNAIAGEPEPADVNRDGASDLVATIIVSPSIGQQQRMVVAISGRSGAWLWSYLIDETPRTASATAVDRPAVLVQGRETKLVAIVDGSEWIGLDPQTGKRRAGPVDLGLTPAVPVQHADLDGDGEPEILAFGQEPGGKERVLRAVSIKSGRELWAQSFDVPSDQLLKGDSSRGLPALLDVDGDGRPEILGRDAGPPSRRLPGDRGVRLIEGANGATRWRVALCPATEAVNDRVQAVLGAPDLDQDGIHEIVIVSACEVRNATTIYVDAISGKGGRRIWSWSVATDDREMAIGRPVWWGRGPDGWPLLALPLGGVAPVETIRLPMGAPLAEPIVHLLEASTGRERHRVIGLADPGFADLDGDGLVDLWGEVDGEVRAFRSEGAEAWRVLGRFDRAGWQRQELPAFWQQLGTPLSLGLDQEAVEAIGGKGVDFDGDGVGDVVTGELQAPGQARTERAGGHTAVARSGRDGRVIWKTQIDPRGRWFNPTSGERYELHAVPLPAGDLDGDGTADVIVNKAMGPNRLATSRGATIEVELLSGRTGARIWSGGLLPASSIGSIGVGVDWTDACVVEPNGRPDVIVGQGAPFGRCCLTRVSGRDGRVLWEFDLPDRQNGFAEFPHFFGDLDGDGVTDALVLIPGSYKITRVEHQAVALSLRDGKRLWSETLALGVSELGKVRVGDVDGDGRQEVVVLDNASDSMTPLPRVRVLDGRDGKARWTRTLKSGRFLVQQPHDLALASFDGDTKQSVCVSLSDLHEAREVIILDSSGKERARRGLGETVLQRGVSQLKDAFAQMNRQTARTTVGDFDGDGRDELLMYAGDKLQVWDRDLKDVWFWPTRFRTLEQVIPAASGRPGTVVVPPGVFLNGATGQPRSMGQAPLLGSSAQAMPRVLDAGDAERAPLLITSGAGATVCREAVATRPDGSVAPPRGKKVLRGLYRDDPRWARPLPWTKWMVGALGPSGALGSGCLALANVFVPLAMLRLVTRRRRAFKMWALMVLPVAAAVPLVVYQAVLPWLSTGEGWFLSTETRVFLTGTVAGIPVVYFVVVLGGNLVRRRWKRVLAFVGVSVLATLVAAVGWVGIDRRSMAVNVEHYDWEGWERVGLVGAYAAALLWGVSSADFGDVWVGSEEGSGGGVSGSRSENKSKIKIGIRIRIKMGAARWG